MSAFNMSITVDDFKKLSAAKKYDALTYALDGANDTQKYLINKSLKTLKPLVLREAGVGTWSEFHPVLAKEGNSFIGYFGLVLALFGAFACYKGIVNDLTVFTVVGFLLFLSGLGIFFKIKKKEMKREILEEIESSKE